MSRGEGKMKRIPEAQAWSKRVRRDVDARMQTAAATESSDTRSRVGLS